jgi:hypothetical protein
MIHVNKPTSTPTAVQTASGRGSASANRGVERTTRALRAATMAINAQSIQAGKNAPNKVYEGAPTYEQPTSVDGKAIRRVTCSREGTVIV